MVKMRDCAATLLLGLVLACGSVVAQQASGLIAKNPIRLTNVEGRMDHLGVDLKGQRLFVTAFDNHKLEVLDLKTGRQMHTPRSVLRSCHQSAVRRLWWRRYCEDF